MNIIKIGNASGYWGDDLSALKKQLNYGKLDFIALDFLAEITMSILKKQQLKDPNRGFAYDFLTQIEENIDLIYEKKTKIITNAGGINPLALYKEIINIVEKKGYPLSVGVIYGDDIYEEIEKYISKGISFKNLDDGREFKDIKDRLLSANIYFGAFPVAMALDEGVDILVAGRITDTALTLGPIIHSFGLQEEDYDKLASGVVAGHIIECGAQVCGGNHTLWHNYTWEKYLNIAYPIIEFNEDGTFIVTKHQELDGMVNEFTVKEQLLYEIGDPKEYITPEVVADFTSIEVKDLGNDRVKVSNIKGYPPTEFLKVSMSYHYGYKASGNIIIIPPNIKEKAEFIKEIFWGRLKEEYEEVRTDLIGLNSTVYSKIKGSDHEPQELMIRFSVRDKDKKKIEKFSKLLPTLILSGPTGMVVQGGRPRIQEVVAYWPTLIPKEHIKAHIKIYRAQKEKELEYEYKKPKKTYKPIEKSMENIQTSTENDNVKIKIRDIAIARSGDKGDNANIGLIAKEPKYYKILENYITEDMVKNYFKDIVKGKVKKYYLPNINAVNFILEHSLEGGGTISLNVDPQGKMLSEVLLSMEITIPRSLI